MSWQEPREQNKADWRSLGFFTGARKRSSLWTLYGLRSEQVLFSDDPLQNEQQTMQLKHYREVLG